MYSKKPEPNTQQKFYDIKPYLDDLKKLQNLFNSLGMYPPNANGYHEQFTFAIQAYEGLKQMLSKIIAIEEINAIEQSITERTPSIFPELLFIPEFQSEYEQAYKNFKKVRDEKQLRLLDEEAKIAANSDDRQDNFLAFAGYMIIPSLFIVGIPFLLGSLVAALADAVITGIRMEFKIAGIIKAGQEFVEKREHEIQTIHEKINKGSDSIRLKQSFFNIATQRHRKEYKEFESKVTTLVKPGS